jgi:hypothetical protein
VDETERVVPGLDVHFPGGHEDGFEPDTLCSDVAVGATVGARLRALSDVANSFDVSLVKAVFIALNDNLI